MRLKHNQKKTGIHNPSAILVEMLKSVVVPQRKPRSEYVQLSDTSPLVFVIIKKSMRKEACIANRFA